MPKKKTDRGQKIVSNMGLFWKRDHVRWKGNKRIGKAQLAGRRRSAKKKGEVDFWKQTGVYALYAEYDLIYVGQAGLSDQSNLGNRLKSHLTDDLAGRWDMFSWFGLQKVTVKNKVGKRTKVNVSTKAHLANVLEGIIIEVAEPPMNSQKGRFGSRVERYIQVDDSPDPEHEANQKILQRIHKLEGTVLNTKNQLKRAIKNASK
jgi:hypothetical protein